MQHVLYSCRLRIRWVFWVLSTLSSALLCTCVSSTELRLVKATAWMLEQQLAESQPTNDGLQADLFAFKLL